MDNTFFCSLMQCSLGFSEHHFLVIGVFLLGLSYFFFNGFQSGFYGPVPQPSHLALFCALFCRFVVSQLALTPYNNVFTFDLYNFKNTINI